MKIFLSKIYRGLIATIVACLLTPTASAIELPDEDLSYAIMYKWGLINKQAGWAVLSLRNNPDRYNAMLSAGTVPWADKVFLVRDTLKSAMVKKNCMPLQYIKISHEGKDYSYNRLDYTRSNGIVTATVERARRRGDGPLVKSDTILHASEPGVDMLSVFYYMRHLDFDAMNSGDVVKLNVFSGKRVEVLTIHYGGRETIKIDGKKYPTYVITFTFTMKGKESDYPMYCWMSTDSQRIPLKMEGQLPFGKVQAFYKGIAKQ